MSHRIVASLLAAGLLTAGSAFAAARTYVASYGNDANAATSCGPTAPCRTFAAAMPVTDFEGQIIVLDSAGYGSATINKSLSIIAPDGIYAGLTAASGDVVTIATTGVNVILRGLAITGGTTGINMTSGSKLQVENCQIAGTGSNYGIVVSTAANVNIVNTTLRDHYYSIQAYNGAAVKISNSRILNAIEGVVLTGGTTGTTKIDVADTAITGVGGTSSYCVDNWALSGTIGIINVTRTTASNCYRAFANEGTAGSTMTVSHSSASSSDVGFKNYSGTMTVSNSTAAGNTSFGFHITGGTFNSLGNNTVVNNGTDTSGIITIVSPN